MPLAYPRAMTLTTAEALRDHLGDPDLRIADVRWWLADRAKGRRDYMEAHLPGAVFVRLNPPIVGAVSPSKDDDAPGDHSVG